MTDEERAIMMIGVARHEVGHLATCGYPDNKLAEVVTTFINESLLPRTPKRYRDMVMANALDALIKAVR